MRVFRKLLPFKPTIPCLENGGLSMPMLDPSHVQGCSTAFSNENLVFSAPACTWHNVGETKNTL